MNEKVGIAGVGALGTIVAKAFPLEGYTLHAVSDLGQPPIDVPNVDFQTLAAECDVIVECLPAAAVPALATEVLRRGKTLIMISSCALVLHPEIITLAKNSNGRILVPSGALSGLDAVGALNQNLITESKIISTKHPKGFQNAPFVIENKIDLSTVQSRFMIFSGNVLEAARAFPANVNVAASLALAGIGPERTLVEVWADPAAKGNSHEIIVSGGGTTIRSKIDNLPDPMNPKSSMQAGYSIVSALKKRKSSLTHF
jgi:aspartate dehydrogenase